MTLGPDRLKVVHRRHIQASAVVGNLANREFYIVNATVFLIVSQTYAPVSRILDQAVLVFEDQIGGMPGKHANIPVRVEDTSRKFTVE
jgi:hypothetical protein